MLALQPCRLEQVKALSPSAGAQFKMLMAEGWVEQCEATSQLSTIQYTFANAHKLTDEQQLVVDAVTQAAGYGCFLLHGILDVVGGGHQTGHVHLGVPAEIDAVGVHQEHLAVGGEAPEDLRRVGSS